MKKKQPDFLFEERKYKSINSGSSETAGTSDAGKTEAQPTVKSKPAKAEKKAPADTGNTGKKAGKKKQSKWPTVILIFVFIIGLGVLFYPTVSNWWNSFHSSRAIANYAEEIAKISEEDYQHYLDSAKEYNELVAKKDNQYSMTDDDLKRYKSELDFSGGIMGYIEIEKIKVSLPIYHGTADSVLQIAVGHLDWTSLPIGGEGTHCVLSGHRGLPSAKLFTDLDELVEGDTFVIRVLDEIYTYEVDKISIVLPQDTSELTIVPGEDYCTLVTCTPYGINTHRLLVRGTRVDNAKTAYNIRITSDATRIEPLIMAPIIAAPILLVILIIVIINDRRRGTLAGKAKKDFSDDDDD